MPDGNPTARPKAKPNLEWIDFSIPPPKPAKVKQYLIWLIPKDGPAHEGYWVGGTYDPDFGWNRTWYSTMIPMYYADVPRPSGMGPDPAAATTLF